MKAKFSNYYRKQGGRMVYVYHVTGTKEELAAYKEAQGDHYREDETSGKPLFFSPQPLGKKNENISLMITPNGTVVADDADRQFERHFKLDDYILQEQAKLMAVQAMGGGGIDFLSNMTASRPVDDKADIPEAVIVETATEKTEEVPT